MSEKGWFHRWERWQQLTVLGLFCVAGSWFGWRILLPSTTSLTHGFGAYYSASRLLSKGELSADIYDPAFSQPIVREDSQGQVNDIFNANPPTTTLILWPLAFLTITQARLVWTVLNVVFLIAGLGLLSWGFGVPLRTRQNWPVWLLVLTFGLLFRPVIQNFLFGQAYLFIFFLLALATAAFFKNISAGGLALALAVLLKTTGWPLILLLLWLRKGRYLAWTAGTAAVIFLAALPLFPLKMWLAYSRLLVEVGRSPLICVPAYQTTRSWLCHLFAPDVFWYEAVTKDIPIPSLVQPAYFITGSLCLVLLLRLARNQPAPAWVGFICWSVLFLPLGEVHHHIVLLIPFVWLIVRWPEQSRASRLTAAISAVCYLFAFPVNAPQFQTGWPGLLAYPYLAGAWLLFAAVLLDHKSEILPFR